MNSFIYEILKSMGLQRSGHKQICLMWLSLLITSYVTYLVLNIYVTFRTPYCFYRLFYITHSTPDTLYHLCYFLLLISPLLFLTSYITIYTLFHIFPIYSLLIFTILSSFCFHFIHIALHRFPHQILPSFRLDSLRYLTCIWLFYVVFWRQHLGSLFLDTNVYLGGDIVILTM